MNVLIRQEIIKLLKKKSTFIFPVFIIMTMLGTVLLMKQQKDIYAISDALNKMFNAPVVIVLIMITVSSSIISMESQFGTLRILLYRKYSRFQVLSSKWIVLCLYSLILYSISIIMSLIIVSFFFPSFSNGNIQSLLLNIIGDFISLWFIISLVLMIATFINNSGIAVSIGTVFYLSTYIIGSLYMNLIQQWEFLKWGPLNMFLLTDQLQYERLVSPLTKLTTSQLLFGNLFYLLLFLIIGQIAFAQKKV